MLAIGDWELGIGRTVLQRVSQPPIPNLSSPLFVLIVNSLAGCLCLFNRIVDALVVYHDSLHHLGRQEVGRVFGERGIVYVGEGWWRAVERQVEQSLVNWVSLKGWEAGLASQHWAVDRGSIIFG